MGPPRGIKDLGREVSLDGKNSATPTAGGSAKSTKRSNPDASSHASEVSKVVDLDFEGVGARGGEPPREFRRAGYASAACAAAGVLS